MRVKTVKPDNAATMQEGVIRKSLKTKALGAHTKGRLKCDARTIALQPQCAKAQVHYSEYWRRNTIIMKYEQRDTQRSTTKEHTKPYNWSYNRESYFQRDLQVGTYQGR